MSKVQRYNELLANADSMSLQEVIDAREEISPDLGKMKKAKDAKMKIAAKKSNEPEDNKKYKYPFKIHMAGRNLETDHIFKDGKEYTKEEIRKVMLEHQYYDFSGKVVFEYLATDNVLLPIFQQHKKG